MITLTLVCIVSVTPLLFSLDSGGGRDDSWPAAQSLGRVFMSLPVMTSIIDQ